MAESSNTPAPGAHPAIEGGAADQARFPAYAGTATAGAPPAGGAHATSGPDPRPGPNSRPAAAGAPGGTGPTAAGGQPGTGPTSGAPPIGLPPRPTTVAETDLDPIFLEELTLKTVVSHGTITGNDLAERLRLPLAGVVEHTIGGLRRENMIEPVGSAAAAIGLAGINLRATERGAQRARQIAERSGYIGPAPVPLRAFDYALRQQLSGRRAITRDLVWRRLAHLVLEDEVVDRVGSGVQSGGPIFLYGHAGNGKTAIAASIARMLTGGVFVPFAVEVDGQVFRVFDSTVHHPLPPEAQPSARFDERWVLCYPPFVQVGGELRLEQLDLLWNERQRYYDCPIQVKAAGGVLLIDDFGRQQHRPDDLLNRWIIPLETGVDYLTLISGGQVALPFTPLLVFATNLEPKQLMDDAFLRRLPCKVGIPDPSAEAYHEIFRRACGDANIEFVEASYTYLTQRYYDQAGRPLRASQPRDLLRLLVSCARYFGVPPQMSQPLIDAAATLYFV